MLTNVRAKVVRCTWIGEQTWFELLNYWDTQKFKEKSTKNKMNRTSARSEALHSPNQNSHSDIDLGKYSSLSYI